MAEAKGAAHERTNIHPVPADERPAVSVEADQTARAYELAAGATRQVAAQEATERKLWADPQYRYDQYKLSELRSGRQPAPYSEWSDEIDKGSPYGDSVEGESEKDEALREAEGIVPVGRYGAAVGVDEAAQEAEKKKQDTMNKATRASQKIVGEVSAAASEEAEARVKELQKDSNLRSPGNVKEATRAKDEKEQASGEQERANVAVPKSMTTEEKVEAEKAFKESEAKAKKS